MIPRQEQGATGACYTAAMRGLAAWIAMAILAISASGQSPKRQRQPMPSPGEIIQMFDAATRTRDLLRVWKALHISSKWREITADGVEQSADEIHCDYRCEAAVVTEQPVLFEPGNDRVIRFCVQDASECRFLLLHESEGSWSLIDYVDVTVNKYHPPAAHIVDGGNRRWLVIDCYGGGGSGVWRENAAWYEIHNDRFRFVLGVANQGHDVNGDPERSFSSRFLRFERTQGKEVLRFTFRRRLRNS